ncbi:hypothetical protein B7P43_G06094 [Cryptotermes secundus]|uniref:Fatty acid synthase n=1 Tax=Cryptotermes secundus TaxID=105785 RepID=A0A2J7QQM6_9NEOP|nr:hypothetical protein B7P43_G06094 [Cryptotermes secundus]
MGSVTPEEAVADAMQLYDQQGCLHEQFVRQAKALPEAIAVVTHNGMKVTYSELDQMSEELAIKLRHIGVRNNIVVGILMERCLEYVVSYIAILRAGGAYMPLEVSYPSQLLTVVLEDSQPTAVCTKAPFLERLAGSSTLPVLLDAGWFDRVQEENSQLSPLKNTVQVSLDDMAFTAYSSGTTGKPKGIQCPHRAAVFSFYWRHIAYPYGEDEREACNIFFVWEMLRPLLRGVPLYIIPDDVIYDPPQLARFLVEHRITRMLFTPSLLQAVLDFKGLHLNKAFRFMRQVWLCGEVVTRILRDRFIQLFPHVQLLNLYSISECHDVACSDLSLGKLPSVPCKLCPVGKLLPFVHVLVMDDKQNVEPVGVRGEIYIKGPALAIGYLNRPELNAERFITYREHGRLYRTGDWGYMLSDGSLEICGRCDSMVKIRGYSIETQAVEAALLELPMVNAGYVSVEGDEGSDKFLVAYIVSEGKVTQKEVRAALKNRLPFYMIPSRFIFINSIPLLESSGKLDKKALSVMLEAGNNNYLSPHDLHLTPLEHQLAVIWGRVLKLNVIDVHENFFDLGGHSLLATHLVSEINEHLGIQLQIYDVLQHPTVHSLVNFIEKPTETSSDVTLDLPAVVERHAQDKAPLDIHLRAFWRSLEYPISSSWCPERILLTGATGYLGAFVLKELLQNTKTVVYCLVRESLGFTAMDRICSSLQKFGISELDEKLELRIVPIKGDVSLLNLGMSEEDYVCLSYTVDSIIHAAATVNLVRPYSALYSTNVLGTANILTFAMGHKIMPVHYISTNAVFPEGLQNCREDANMLAYADKLRSGYAQTKWAAEQLVMRAQDRGLPAAVYRCGNIGGSREEASWNPADFTLLMLQGCLYTKMTPDIDWQIELSPADFVSRVIVEVSQDVLHSLGKVFHIINPCTMNCRDLWQLLRSQGYQLDLVPYADWYQKVKETARSTSEHSATLANLLYLLDALVIGPDSLSKYSTFAQTNLQASLQMHGLTYPPVDSALMHTYISHLTSIGLIPHPTRGQQNTACLLHGKVALVTGASSGIGAAIGEHLAAAGAKVALAARRTDRLKDLEAQIARRGGTAVAITMDVCDERQVHDGVKLAESLLGPVDILVNSAGVLYYTLMKNVHVEEWHMMVDVNVKGVLNCVGTILGRMVEQRRGHIVNISSDGGRKGFPGLAVYCGTKFFVEGLSQAMRQEVAEFGVKITCIQPGDVKTELFQRTTDLEVGCISLPHATSQS